jgi:DNA-binding NarL/FixJ family response regulator
MDKNVRVVIADDHAIIRDGLRSLISSAKDFEIVGEAEDGRQAVESVETLKPDLVLTDLSMPEMDGIDLIKAVKKCSPRTKVVALTVHRGEEFILATLKAGADGYILKDASYGELMMAIRSVLKGKRYISPEISGNLTEGLTPKEREVLKLIAEGYTNQKIADTLYISTHTVETHRQHLMGKLDVHNTAALIARAIEKGLVSK